MRTLIIFLFIGLLSCTDNVRARKFGGTEIIKLKDCEKFLNATWKEESVWIVTHDTCKNVFVFREKSSFGIMEGELIFKK